MLDPSSREYLEIMESLPEGPTNQQAEMCTTTGELSKQDSRQGNENQYEKLLLRNISLDKEQVSSAEQDLNQNENTSADADEIPDYVEIIGDDSVAGNAMTTSTSSPATVKNRYETLKLAPGPSHREQGDSTCSVIAEDNQEEEGYVELLPENEAGGKECWITASADNELVSSDDIRNREYWSMLAT